MSARLVTPRASSRAAFALLVSLAGASWGDEQELSQVIVTASRVPEGVADSFWSATVLTRADIEARQVQSMPELLADLAGINIDQTGGLGQASSVFIRGAESDHTLLLIDGVRVGSATLGAPPFAIIPLEQIDHVEVVRGPRSTLYGSDAVGGVIQIFTRRATEPGLSFGASAMDGSHDTHEFTGNLAARGERAWVSLSGDTLTTDGIASCLPGALSAGAGCFQDHPSPAPNGFHNHSGALTAGIKVTDQLSAQAGALVTDGWTAFDGDFDNNLEFTEKVATLRLEQALGDAWHVRVTAGRDVDEERDFLNLSPAGVFDTTRNSASLQVDGKASDVLRVLGGFDYERVRVDSDTPFTVTTRNTRGVFGELRAEAGPWSALAGARVEDNGQFGSHGTGNLGLARRLGAGVRATLTWGTAFRAPTFDELYFPGFGNPQLAPEASRSVEAGLDGGASALHWSAHVYQTDIDHLIAFDPSTFTPQNINRARIRGVELQADWRSREWGVGGELTAMEPLNRSAGSEYDNLLNRRARQSGSLTLRRFLARAGSVRGSLAAVARWEGRRFDDLANTLPMGGYLRVDLLTQWALAGGWSFEASAANLFDRDYQTAAYFAQDRRHLGVTIRYQSQPK